MPVLIAMLLLTSVAYSADWPQWLGPQRDGVWREAGILEKFPAGGPKIRWRTPIGGGYSGPAVANGKVLVTDRQAKEGSERVLCLSEKDGAILWKQAYEADYRISYPAGPRATPAVTAEQVFTLGAIGDLRCWDLATGAMKWSCNFTKDYGQAPPLWGWSGHPLVDGDKLICMVGGKGTTVVAFDKNTGKELWRALDSQEGHGPGYAPPVIYEAGGKRQLIAWHPQAVSSLDPETGTVYWSQEFPIKQGMSIATPRKAADLLFVTSFYSGAMMLKLAGDRPAASVLWKGKGENEQKTDALHAVMSTPYIKDGYIYGVCSYGQLRCLKASTGERVWETFQATSGAGPVRWSNAFIIPYGEGARVFLFNEQGDLISARLTPKGYEELDRCHLLEPTGKAGMSRKPEGVLWSHPAFANQCMYARNDQEIVCVSLAAHAP